MAIERSGLHDLASDSPAFATHEVFNQSPAFGDLNLYTTDTALREAVEREGGEGATVELERFGAITGARDAFDDGRRANEMPPRLDEIGRASCRERV